MVSEVPKGTAVTQKRKRILALSQIIILHGLTMMNVGYEMSEVLMLFSLIKLKY